MMKGKCLSLVGAVTPGKAAKYLCSGCLRPKPTGRVVYVCENCGSVHRQNEVYVCCDVDSKRPLEADDEA